MPKKLLKYNEFRNDLFESVIKRGKDHNPLNEDEHRDNLDIIGKNDANKRHLDWQEKNRNLALSIGCYVKMLFVDGKENEHMWVNITDVSLDQQNFKGILYNDPIVVTNIKHGDEVVFTRSQIEQYLQNE